MSMSRTFSWKLAEPIVTEPALAALLEPPAAVLLLPPDGLLELLQAASTTAASAATAPSTIFLGIHRVPFK